jgi:RNA polymerase sigma factor (sigma-70 family)
MKVKYDFINETVEIEVDEKLGNLLIDLDKKEYNVNRRETRRHTSLESLPFEDEVFADEDSSFEVLLVESDNEKIHNAISKLKPKQQELIRDIYFDKISVNDYAAREGVSQSAISHRLETVKKTLKYFL